MKCPKCGGSMHTINYQNVEIDRCSECNGIWFDILEAQDLKKLAGSEVIDIGDKKVGKLLNENNIDISCPKCKAKLLRMVDAQQPHIWYEACPICYGTYFDAGEFIDFKKHTILDLLKDMFTKERK